MLVHVRRFCFATSNRGTFRKQSSNGFEIAEADLQIRGPGEFMGVRQSGALPFKIASLSRDQKVLLQARDDVIELIRSDPNLQQPTNRNFKKYLETRGKTQFDFLKTS